MVYDEAWKRVNTGRLNRALQKIMKLRQPPSYNGKPLKIFYGTQLEGKPPAFLIFVNHPEGFKDSYVKFIEVNLRELLDLKHAPIKLILKERTRERV